MYALPQSEVTELLDQRVAALGAVIEQADTALSDAARTVPAIFLSEEHYAQHMRTAEHDWIAQFSRKLRNGQLTWPQRRSA
jgi:hypothetical protein